MKSERNIERDCIDDEGHDIIPYHHWKKCEKCGMTWHYKNENTIPTKVEDEKLDQSEQLSPHQR